MPCPTPGDPARIWSGSICNVGEVGFLTSREITPHVQESRETFELRLRMRATGGKRGEESNLGVHKADTDVVNAVFDKIVN